MVWRISEKAAALHRSALVWDNHVCLPMDPDDRKHILDMERFAKAGCNVATINAGYGDVSLDTHIALLAHFRDWIGAHSGDYVLAGSVSEILAAQTEGKMAVLFNVEGAGVLEGDLRLIERFYQLGVRWMLVAYNEANEIGGGCLEEDTGLTGLGREWVAEMERVGMTICCSHTGHGTALEVMAMATKPVILSHSNPLALHDHPRNVPDEVIRACANTGGVIGINGINIFHRNHHTDTGTLARAIEYVADLVGLRHVGIALDFVFNEDEFDDYVETRKGTYPKDWSYDEKISYAQPEQLPEITGALVERGYSGADIQGILGKNWLRVAEACWV